MKVYRYIQLLSLDVVAGALCCGVMAATWFQVVLPWSWWAALPVSVWVVYTADHLIDAIRLGESASSERHQFHVQWIVPIGVIWTLAALFCCAVIPFYVPVELLILGVVAGLVSAGHFLLVWWVKDEITPWLTKELGVALVYTVGVWGGGLALTEMPLTFFTSIPVIQFFFLALSNLLTFSVYEEMADQKDGFTSWARGLGSTMTMRVITGLLIVTLLLGLFIIARSDSQLAHLLQITYFSMGSLLAWVAYDQQRFSNKGMYRIAADGAFLLPVIWLFAY